MCRAVDAMAAGIFFCVSVFIMAGFAHSIANIFCFGTVNMLSVRSILYLCVVIVGNAAGGMLYPLLDRLGSKK